MLSKVPLDPENRENLKRALKECGHQLSLSEFPEGVLHGYFRDYDLREMSLSELKLLHGTLVNVISMALYHKSLTEKGES